MNKKKILKEYNGKIKLITEYNKFYYEKNLPKISDDIYDKLKQEILSLEIKHVFLKSKYSPSRAVGYKPSKNFEKKKHRTPMLSLSNAFLKLI